MKEADIPTPLTPESLNPEDLSALTSDSLLEAAEGSARLLNKAILETSQRFDRLPVIHELTSRPSVHVHTRAPATPVGLFAAGRALVLAFDISTTDVPETGDLLRFFSVEGDTLRPAPNPLAHHAELSRTLQDLYRSHRGRVQLKGVIQGAPGQVFLNFTIRQGDDAPDRTSLLGLDFSQVADLPQGLQRARIQTRAFPPEAPVPDFSTLPELEQAPWKPGQPTSALYYHTRVGPLYAFVERGALKLRDKVDIPRGAADVVIEGAADPAQGIQPYRTEVLYPATDRDNGEVLVRAQGSEKYPAHTIHYTALPRRFQVLELQHQPGWTLPDDAGRLSAMFLWAGQELLYLGGRPGDPFAHHTAQGPDHLYVFRGSSGRLTLHAYDADKRRLQASIHDARAYALLPDGRLFVLPVPPQAGGQDMVSAPALEHTLLAWQTPFTAGLSNASPDELAFLRSFDLMQVRSMLQTLRTLAPLIEKRAFLLARQNLDQVLVTHPFVERLPEVRTALDALGGVLGRILDVAAELQDLHQRRRQSLQALMSDVDHRLNPTQHPDSAALPTDLPSANLRVTQLRALRGQLEQLAAERFIPPDVQQAQDQLRDRLDEGLKQTSTLARALIEERLGRIRQQFKRLDGQLQQLSTLKGLQQADELLTQEQNALNACTATLAQLELSAQTRLKLSQQLSTCSVEWERHQNTLRLRRRALSEASLREGFTAWWAQLNLRLATEPRGCTDLPAVEACRDTLLAEVEGQRASLADFPDLQEQLTQAAEAVKSRLEARKRELLQDRETERQRLETLLQLRLQSLQVSARANRLAPEALEGWLASHAETLAALTVLEQLRRAGFHAEASQAQGRLDQLKRLLVAERRESAVFSIEDDALVLGDVRLHRNRLAFELQETRTAEGPALSLTGTGLSYPLSRLKKLAEGAEVLEPPAGYQGRLAETLTQSRAERLAYRALRLLESHTTDASLHELCRSLALAHPEEEYVPDLHDVDAARLLEALWPIWRRLGTLRYTAPVRLEAAACLTRLTKPSLHPFLALALQLEAGSAPALESEADLEADATSAAVDEGSPLNAALQQLAPELSTAARQCLSELLIVWKPDSPAQISVSSGSGDFEGIVVAQLPMPLAPPTLTCHPAALEAAQAIVSPLLSSGKASPFSDRAADSLRMGAPDGFRSASLFEPLLARRFPALTLERRKEAAHVAGRLLEGEALSSPWSASDLTLGLTGFASSHPRLDEGLFLEPAEWYANQRQFEEEIQPRLFAFRDGLARVRKQLTDTLQLEELSARPLARFVWTRLMRRAYLPLIAQALEKQLGSLDRSGEDQMGLLLLVSPPGYGKTELLKKIASLLGYAFVSVSGTSLSKSTTGLDPTTAPDASSQAALERLLFGLELKENVLLDIEDVQACSDELLSRLLPLCDATRTLEIVRDGRPVRLSLQGRRAAIVMTLNPLLATIPQALANRATLLNLGDVADRFADDFALSYLEVGAPVNPTLEVASSRGDIEVMALALADGRPLPSLMLDAENAALEPSRPGDEAAPTLKGRYARAELVRIQAVLEHATAIRDVLMAVNQACLASASVAAAFRETPAFELQGSYRDMVELCRHIQPDWSSEQRTAALLRHYEGQAGLLGDRGEYNLLHFKQLLGLLSPTEQDRLSHILETFRLMQSRDKAVYVLMERLTEVSRAVQQLPDTLRGLSQQLMGQLASQHGAQQTLVEEQVALVRTHWEHWQQQNWTEAQAQRAQQVERDEAMQQLEAHLHLAQQETSAQQHEAQQRLGQTLVSALEKMAQHTHASQEQLHEDLLQVRAGYFEAGGRLQEGLQNQLSARFHHSLDEQRELLEATLRQALGTTDAQPLGHQISEHLRELLQEPLSEQKNRWQETSATVLEALEKLTQTTEKGLSRLDLRQLLRSVLATLPPDSDGA